MSDYQPDDRTQEDDRCEEDDWLLCEGCGVHRPDAAPARWSDHNWCDDCNGGRER